MENIKPYIGAISLGILIGVAIVYAHQRGWINWPGIKPSGQLQTVVVLEAGDLDELPDAQQKMIIALAGDNLILLQDMQTVGPDKQQWAFDASASSKKPAWVYRHGKGAAKVMALPENEVKARAWIAKEGG